MSLSRRNLLQASLGAAQLGLLGKFGLLGRSAHAQTATGPTRLLTLFFNGGWMPQYLWCPYSAQEIDQLIPPVTTYFTDEPVYFGRAHVKNLDGSGDQTDGGYPRLRVPELWNAAELGAGRPDPRTALNGLPHTSPHGWSWVRHQLWNNCSVVHGIDQGTAAHESGVVSAMCGIASGEYRSPALHAMVANALASRPGLQDRPLPSVSIGAAPVPEALHLSGRAAPVLVTGIEALQLTLSRRNPAAWAGFRQQSMAQVDFDGNPLGMLETNPVEDRVLRRLRALRGQTTTETDALYRRIHEQYHGVSKLLARDVVSALDATVGVRPPPESVVPFWMRRVGEVGDPAYFEVRNGSNAAGDSGETWNESFNLALRLLKSNVTTAVSVDCPAFARNHFDTHGAGGHPPQFLYARSTFDVVGRLLGEMKATPSGIPNKSLLDDTLVLLLSDFSRTMPQSRSCEHWPFTSVAFIGGGIRPNRMIGGYTVTPPFTAEGFVGRPSEVIEEGGQRVTRQLRSADVIHTALRIMGIENFFIPGGSGEIVGVRA